MRDIEVQLPKGGPERTNVAPILDQHLSSFLFPRQPERDRTPRPKWFFLVRIAVKHHGRQDSRATKGIGRESSWLQEPEEDPLQRPEP